LKISRNWFWHINYGFQKYEKIKELDKELSIFLSFKNNWNQWFFDSEFLFPQRIVKHRKRIPIVANEIQ